MTREERQLLKITARSLLKLEHEIRDRVAEIEAVLEALFRHHGNTEMALARLRVQADLLKMKGTPSRYRTLFLDKASGNKVADSELDVSFGGSDGSE